MGCLTTHVLDTARGKPGAGMIITLYRHLDDRFERVKSTVTNTDGRCEDPLLEGAAMVAGRYRLVFEAGAFFRTQGVTLADPPFLDQVPIDFAIADVDAHYHVPLLISPWSYSTYRGS